jgi:glycosyltransferase involved in cell wall biosynthesis
MMDDHSLFPDADDQWTSTHETWIDAADVMAVTADDLVRQLSSKREDVLLLPNAVRMEDWAQGGHSEIPEDLAPVRDAAVVVGYYGVIGDWFDWDMWETACASWPEWAFVLIGLPYHESDAARVSECTHKFSNVHYLGPKAYTDLPDYLAHFDVTTIPFCLNEITHACSPLKLFEYMAGGKPVVASPMREILKYESVVFAEGPEEYARKLEEALRLGQDPDYRSTLEQEAMANTWRARAQLLGQVMEGARERQGNVPRRHSHQGRMREAAGRMGLSIEDPENLNGTEE